MKNRISFLFFLLFLVVACQVQKVENIPVEIKEPTKPIVEVPEIPFIIETNHFEELLKQQAGKVVLVNLWATWCNPCVKEMPALEKLHQNYQDKDLKVILLSLDELEHIDSLVTPFLEEQKLTMDSYVIGGVDRGNLVNSFDPLWMGIVPTSFVFDRTGKKIQTITGKMSYQGFEKKILSALNQK